MNESPECPWRFRATLHWLLNPSLRVVNRDESVVLEVNKTWLAISLALPILLGYLPLGLLLYYVADRIPSDPAFVLIIFVAATIPVLFLVFVFGSLWMRSNCLKYDKRTKAYFLPEMPSPIRRERVRALAVQMESLDPRPEQETPRSVQLIMFFENDQSEVQAHFIAGGNRQRLRRSADEFAAFTGLAASQVEDKVE